MSKKILLVLNPNSGVGVPAKIIEQFYNILDNNGYDVDLSFTKRAKHATEIVENSEFYDLVFSIDIGSNCAEGISFDGSSSSFKSFVYK